MSLPAIAAILVSLAAYPRSDRPFGAGVQMTGIDGQSEERSAGAPALYRHLARAR